MTNVEIKENITKCMEQYGIKLSSLAQKCDMSVSRLSKLINGDQTVSVNDLVLIAEALDINADELLPKRSGNREVRVDHLNHLCSSLMAANTARRDGNENLFMQEMKHIKQTVSLYLGLRSSETKVFMQATRTRQDNPDSTNIADVPRILVSDVRDDQILSDQLSVGIWFPKGDDRCYFAVHFMKSISRPERAAMSEIRPIVDICKTYITEENGFSVDGTMKLGGKTNDVKVLEAGSIMFKEYDLTTLHNEDTLKADLMYAFDVYQSILAKMTKQAKCALLTDTATKDTRSTQIDAKTVRTAFEREGFKCELDPGHVTFIDGSTSKPYMDEFMLIPAKYQKEYKKSLNVDANICCVCPVCRAKLDHASDEERQEIIMRLFLKHKMMLKDYGVEVVPAKLLNMHGFS